MTTSRSQPSTRTLTIPGAGQAANGEALHPSPTEEYQVSDRLYETHLQQLCLPSSVLADRGLVIDAGSGFSSFVEEVNRQFGDTGTHAIGFDLQYARMPGTNGNLALYLQRGGRLTGGYGKTQERLEDKRRANSPSQEHELVYAAMHNEVSSSGNYLAGSYFQMPLRDHSVDLLVADNSILTAINTFSGLPALADLPRVLRSNGEARLNTSCFDWDNRLRRLDVAVLWTTDQIEREARITSIFETFRMLQANGAKFWQPVETDHDNSYSFSHGCLIMRFDDQAPVLDPPAGHESSYTHYDPVRAEHHSGVKVRELYGFAIDQNEDRLLMRSTAK